MNQPFDGFGDVIESNEGIFTESDGLQAYDSVKHTTQPHALVVQVHCASCGYPRHLEIPWPELIALKYNISPHEAWGSVPSMRQFSSAWRQTNTARGVNYAWCPASIQCKCGVLFERPLFFPSECESLMQTARAQGNLDRGQEKQMSDHCFKVARQHGRV